jgi:hypothetical protein
MLLLTRLGLILGVAGALFATFSIGEPPVGMASVDEKGRSFSLAAILHPTLFKMGALLITAGFLCQFIATFP